MEEKQSVVLTAGCGYVVHSMSTPQCYEILHCTGFGQHVKTARWQHKQYFIDGYTVLTLLNIIIHCDCNYIYSIYNQSTMAQNYGSLYLATYLTFH